MKTVATKKLLLPYSFFLTQKWSEMAQLARETFQIFLVSVTVVTSFPHKVYKKMETIYKYAKIIAYKANYTVLSKTDVLKVNYFFLHNPKLCFNLKFNWPKGNLGP